MPDLSNTPLAWNWNRAQDPNSQYGTRRLQFYKIEIVGYDINATTGYNDLNTENPGNPDTYRITYESNNNNEYLESPYSILYPIIRGVAQIGEVYFSGEIDSDNSSNAEGTSTYLVIAVSADTVIDGEDDNFQSTSKSLKQAIEQSIADFTYDDVLVNSVTVVGAVFEESQGPDA